MKKVIIYKSKTSYTKNVHVIDNDTDPNSKSYASLVLLNKKLLTKDRDFISKKKEFLDRIKFSRQFLKRELEKCGSLTCHYCNRTNLIIENEGMKVPQRNKATIDHVIPVSKGGNRFSKKNIVVACGRCNGSKGDMDVEIFLTRVKKNDTSKT
ncbi:MAG: HNH endonuclease [Richelia sp. RM2_1_2]|nr:HNH endonuclease [Richelia sp. RM2_1_2]